MRTIVVVSFDLIRPGEPSTSLAAGSLLATLRRELTGGEVLHHVSVNLLDVDLKTAVESTHQALDGLSLGARDLVAVSAYVWSERVTTALVVRLREHGFAGSIALGGYQVSYASRDQMAALYPGVDLFITSYGEKALLEAALRTERPLSPEVLDRAVEFDELPSPYLSNEIPVEDGQAMVRIESRRGCPFRCAFCAHRDLKRGGVHWLAGERVRLEMKLMAFRGVRKINFVDPVFNQGSEYLGLMEFIAGLNNRPTLALQSRFELITKSEGQRFLELAAALGAHLEFGLQTAVPSEAQAIQRPNRMDIVARVMEQLARSGVSYEVSLIYGLPTQTVGSFRDSITFLREHGCDRITAWPLMLLRGTELYAKRERWGFEERAEGPFRIPVVYRSNSYNEEDWREMKHIAGELAPNNRV